MNGKVVRTEIALRLRTKQFPQEELKRAFEISDADVFVDIKPLNLVKLCGLWVASSSSRR